MDTTFNILEVFVVVSKLHNEERYSDLVHLTQESAYEELEGMDEGQALPMKQHYTVAYLYDHIQAAYSVGWNEGYDVGVKEVVDEYIKKGQL